MKTTSTLILLASAVLALASCSIEPTVVAPAASPEITTERTTRTTDPYTGTSSTRRERTTTSPAY